MSFFIISNYSYKSILLIMLNHCFLEIIYTFFGLNVLPFIIKFILNILVIFHVGKHQNYKLSELEDTVISLFQYIAHKSYSVRNKSILKKSPQN